MAAKRKTNTQYYHDLKFEFLGFDEMELYQPTADWLPNVYKTKDCHPKKKAFICKRFDPGHSFY